MGVKYWGQRHPLPEYRARGQEMTFRRNCHAPGHVHPATLLWAVYLITMSYRPAWYLALCGPDIRWSDIQHITLWIIVAFKFVLWWLVLAVIWLTLWGWQLRKRSAQG